MIYFSTNAIQLDVHHNHDYYQYSSKTSLISIIHHLNSAIHLICIEL